MPPKMTMQMDKETKKMLKSLDTFLSVGETSFSAGIGADIIAKEAKRRAPIGKTGNLKRGIVARQNKVAAEFLGQGSAYVGVDYRIAPHAHLVEFGARGGEMPAQPFMRPAVEAKKNEVASAIEKDLLKRIKKKIG